MKKVSACKRIASFCLAAVMAVMTLASLPDVFLHSAEAATTYDYLSPVNIGSGDLGKAVSCKFSSSHTGIDWSLSRVHAQGSGDYMIYAAYGGTVVKALDVCPHINGDGKCSCCVENKNTFGNFVEIKQDDGNYAWYGHLAYQSVLVKEGQRVEKGDPLGSMGSSGYSEGPHLHFEVQKTSNSYWDASKSINVNPQSIDSNGIRYSTTGYSQKLPVECVSVAEGPWYIKNQSTGGYLTLSGDTSKNNVSAVLSTTLTKKPEQQMRVRKSDSPVNYFYEIAPENGTGHILNSCGTVPMAGEKISFFKDDNNDTQWWGFEKVDGGYIIRSKFNTNLCATAEGSNVVLRLYTGAKSQLWSLEKTQTTVTTAYTFLFPVNIGNSDPSSVVSSAYGMRGDTMHKGVDLSQTKIKACKQGDNTVYAACGGTVITVIDECTHITSGVGGCSCSTTFGNYIVVLHDDGTSAWYGHLTYHSMLVKKGDRVEMGQPLAAIGSAGASTGAHLHFEVHETKNYSSATINVNPLNTDSKSQVTYTTTGYLTTLPMKCASVGAGPWYIQNVADGTYLTVSGDLSKTNVDAKLSATAKADAKSQMTLAASGSIVKNVYKICPGTKTKHILNSLADIPMPGNKVSFYEDDANDTQWFFFEKTDSGYVIRLKFNPNLCLTADGENIVLALYESKKTQLWKPESVTAQTYTVKYDANGGTGAPAAQTKTEGKDLTLSDTVPTRDGYTFLGWATDKAATKAEYAAGGVYTANASVTLYAVWKANSYTVRFNANGGTGTMNDLQLTYDKEGKLPANTFQKDGYTFVGWNTKADGTGKAYTDGQTVKNLTAKPDAVVTLYAQYESSYIPGDINGDGKVNSKDLTRLIKYLSGEAVETVERALDTNGDGKVNMKDYTRLLKFLSGEEVELN